MLKFIFIILGILLTTIGLVNIILYLNLLVMGYSFIRFLIFIFSHFFTLIFFVGIVFLYLGKNWYYNKIKEEVYEIIYYWKPAKC